MIYGVDRLLSDLQKIGYLADKITAKDGSLFAVLPSFEILAGRFIGKVISLGVQATADFPRSVASAIHVKATPQLYEKSDSIPNVRNITDSVLGAEWRYWSKNFGWTSEKTARRLISQINKIFEDA